MYSESFVSSRLLRIKIVIYITSQSLSVNKINIYDYFEVSDNKLSCIAFYRVFFLLNSFGIVFSIFHIFSYVIFIMVDIRTTSIDRLKHILFRIIRKQSSLNISVKEYTENSYEKRRRN